MNLDLLRLTGNGVPLYQQVVERIEEAILAGELAPGTRLPAERELARTLGISRTTSVNAYNELEAKGLIRRHVGRGTFVSAPPDSRGAPFAWRGKVSISALRTEDSGLSALVRSAVDRELISFAAAIPARECFPSDEFRRITDRLLTRLGARAVSLAPPEGHSVLREAIAARNHARVEQVLVLNGSQQGLDLIARCLLDPGDVIVMDRPGYVGAIQTFRAAGAGIVGWDHETADLVAFEDLLVRYRPKFFYTTPTFQNPTGQTLSPGIRRIILETAARYRLPVIEDDPYRELAFDGTVPRSMRELDENHLVIQIGTFSKTLASGLRLGWLIADESIIEQLALFKQRSDVSSPTLQQLVVAEFLNRGLFEHHLARLRQEHESRYRALLDSISRYLPGELQYQPVAGGLYLWCRYCREVDSVELLRQAHELRVAFAGGESFYPDHAGRRHLRLCFTGVSAGQIDEGIRRLGTLLRHLDE